MTSSLIRRNEVSTGVGPVQYGYTYTQDIMSAMFDTVRAEDTFSSSSMLRFNATQDAYKRIKNLNPSEDLSFMPTEAYGKRFDTLIKQNRTQGVSGWDEIPTSDEIIENAVAQADAAKENYDDVMMRAAPDAHPILGNLAGAAGGWITDPVNATMTLATLPLAGLHAARATYGTYALRAAVAEGAIGIGTEVVAQPNIMEWKDKLGREYDIGDAALNVALAGATSFVLSGVGAAIASRLGFIPEELRRAAHTEFKKALDEPQVRGDGGTRIAHQENVKLAIDDIVNGRPINPDRFNQRAVAGKYLDDFVSYDHFSLAQKIVGSGLKASEAKKFARKDFLSAMRDEYTKVSGLERGDLIDLQKRHEKLSSDISKAETSIRASEAKLRAKESQPIKSEAAIDSIILAESEVRAAKVEAAKMQKKLASIDGLIESTSRAIEADDILKRIDDGIIPDQLTGAYTNFKKNLAKASDDIKKYESSMARYADDLIRDERVFDFEEAQEVSIKQHQSTEYEKSVDTEFDRMAEENPDMPVDVEDYDGSIKTMTAKEFLEQRKEDMNLLDAVKACAFG